MPLTREDSDEELRQSVARLQSEVTALRALNAEHASRNVEPTDSGAPHPVQRAEALYRAPKIAPFFKADPALWFIQVEASLRNAGIKNQITMADTVIAHLDLEAVSLISDLVSTPDPNNQYNIIKDRIISTFATSSEAKLRQLLKGQITLDGKPSQILARIRNLSGSSCSDTILRSIFLEFLPENCRAILAATKTETLHEMAQLADTIVDAIGHSPQYTASTSINASSTTADTLEQKIEKLTKAVYKLLPRDRSHSRSRRNPGNKSPRSSRSRSADGLCRIHRKFGEKARHCIKPCSWKPSSDESLN